MIKSFVGPMYSGKTTKMFSIYRKIKNKDNVIVFKPKIDSRDYGILKSRDFEEGIPAICIDTLEEIPNKINKNTKVIFLDEAQFIKGNIQILNNLSINKNINIYISGLDMTSDQEPFGVISDILSISDKVVKLKSRCYCCNKSAQYTYYDGKKDNKILIGDDKYIPLCRKCLSKISKR